MVRSKSVIRPSARGGKDQGHQWTSVAGQPPPSHFLGALKRIQASGKSLLISLTDPREVEPLLTNLSSKGLYLVLDAENEDQVDTLLDIAVRLTHE